MADHFPESVADEVDQMLLNEGALVSEFHECQVDQSLHQPECFYVQVLVGVAGQLEYLEDYCI